MCSVFSTSLPRLSYPGAVSREVLLEFRIGNAKDSSFVTGGEHFTRLYKLSFLIQCMGWAGAHPLHTGEFLIAASQAFKSQSVNFPSRMCVCVRTHVTAIQTNYQPFFNPVLAEFESMMLSSSRSDTGDPSRLGELLSVYKL